MEFFYEKVAEKFGRYEKEVVPLHRFSPEGRIAGEILDMIRNRSRLKIDVVQERTRDIVKIQSPRSIHDYPM